MPQLVKKRRSGWAVLAAGALVASILAVGAGPAAATMHNPDLTPNWSACVGAAGSHDAMFPDVNEDSVHAADINCIAYYGITVGMGDGSYGPDQHVTAFQMKLFVQRTADLMGADGEAVLAGVMLSDPVTRLDMAKLMFGLVDDIRDDVRINRDGKYQVDSNDDNVWEDVDDYFADARAEVPIADSDLIGATYELGITRGTSDNVSTPDSTFEPSANVTRAQMASFITRTLDHSNLRPEGLAIQENNSDDTQVSYRDADFAPIEDARVDVFSSLYPDDAFDEDDGECETRFTKDEGGGSDRCEIDIGDQLTDDDGNVEFTLASKADPITAECGTGGPFEFKTATAGADERTFWAWTGSLGDEVDDETTLAELEQVDRPMGGAAPDKAHITGGLPTDKELAKMGETVTFNVQIQAGDDAIGPDRSRNPYHLVITHYFVGTSDDGTHTAEATPTANQTWNISADLPYDWDFLARTPTDGDSNPATPNTRAVVSVAQSFHTAFDNIRYPNADGSFDINLSSADLDAANNNDDVLVRFTLRPFIPGNDLIDANLLEDITADANHAEGNSATNPLASGYALFSDDPVAATTVSGKSSTGYRIVRAGSTGNSITVTVNDQYGDGFRNAGIAVESTLDAAARANDNARYPEEVDRTVQERENNADGQGTDTDTVGSFNTRRDGTYRIGYNYTGSGPAVETVRSFIRQVLGDNPDTDAEETDFELVARLPAAAADDGTTNVYFAQVGTRLESDITTSGTAEFLNVLVADTASRAVVVDIDTAADVDSTNSTTATTGVNPQVYYYDEEDTFVVGNTGATFEMWEEALAAIADGKATGTVQWESYEFDRPRDRAVWELTLVTCGD
ncbi:MAG: S-layer homology domain-containing protein [Gemmatimonadota bacterium]|nr:S-layer homology domain-containing protein [Gemmatimonadota bacterium]